ncbi:MAG: acetate kinase [Geobacteraceae bacterium]|nr:acetate kinase [Geobacteraceae bacterium]
MNILAINCGSSSVKYQLFDWNKKEIIAKGLVEKVALEGSFILHEVPGKDTYRQEIDCPNHAVALDLIMRALTDREHGVLSDLSQISAVGHRIVHGGEKFTKSVLIDDDVLEGINSVRRLAPLHNPAHIAGIEAVRSVLPDIPSIAIFDTAFHQTMPEHAYIYPLPYDWYTKHSVRRYGFHGTSHLYVSKRAAVLLGKNACDCNLVTMHIGNGVSSCAIKDGISVDTSMGLTPLAGAVMGTRCGDIDPAIPLFMMEIENVTSKEIDNILNKKSGVLGITGKYADWRDIIENAEKGDRQCKLAMEIEAYQLKKYIGAYLVAIGELDAVVFTAGAGEMGWQLREKTLEGLDHIGIRIDNQKNRAATSRNKESVITTGDSTIKVFVIPTNEELVVVEDVVAILAGDYADHMNFQYSFAQPDFKDDTEAVCLQRRAAFAVVRAKCGQ